MREEELIDGQVFSMVYFGHYAFGDVMKMDRRTMNRQYKLLAKQVDREEEAQRRAMRRR